MGRATCVAATALWPTSPCNADRAGSFGAPPTPRPNALRAGGAAVLLTTVTISSEMGKHAEKTLVEMLRVQLAHAALLRIEPTIVGVDSTGGNASCARINAHDMPCQPDGLHAYCAVHNSSVMFWGAGARSRETDRTGTRTVAVDAKYWYALRFLRMGHAVLFSDVDVRLLRSPFDDAPSAHALQGLSDDRAPDDADDERRIGNATQCDRYLHYGAPCQSTGLWMAQPTASSLGFFAHVLESMQNSCEWEQSLFNRVLRHNASRSRGYGPGTWIDALNYSVWSKERYANVGVAERRAVLNAPLRLVAIHVGFVPMHEKLARLRGFA